MLRLTGQHYFDETKRLAHVSVRALDRLEDLSEIQRDRMLALVEREGTQGVYLQATNDVVGSYRQLLLDIQKLRFELGLDEFKGPVPQSTLRGASSTVAFPETNIQQQVFEAVTTMEQIFEARKIPHVVPRK